MGRVDYYHDANAPKANSLVPGASAIVTDDQGRILLQRRSDNARWALPGGVMDIGESIGQAIVREVREETGLVLQPEFVTFTVRWPAGGSGRPGRGPGGGVARPTSAAGDWCR